MKEAAPQSKTPGLPTFYLEAFGCPSSQYEGEAVRSLLLQEGFPEAREGIPEIYLINTCAVTEGAVRKLRKAVRQIKKQSPRTLVVLMGCYPQLFACPNSPDPAPSTPSFSREQFPFSKEQLPETAETGTDTGSDPDVPYPLLEAPASFPPVDLYLGNEERHRLPQLLRKRLREFHRHREKLPPWNLVNRRQPAEPLEKLSPPRLEYRRVRPVLKIQEGCPYQCGYCLVTLARGRPRSLPPAEASRQVRHFLEEGRREIVLAGTNLGQYRYPGCQAAETAGEEGCGNLVDLLRTLIELPSSHPYRLRLSYLEPSSITEELLQLMSQSEKLCPYLYLPLQSASPRVLQLMGRNYTVEDLEKILGRARELMPDLCIHSDLIVGFPGEQEEDHRQTVEWVRRWELSALHLFSYSPRPFTPAYSWGNQVQPEIIKERYRELETLGRELSLKFHQRMQGKKLRVLVERSREGQAEGFSDNYLWTSFPERKSGQAGSLQGSFAAVTAVRSHSGGVEGELD